VRTEQKWTIKSYSEGDEERIFELWKAVNPLKPHVREQWLRWWHWKYRNNPAGNGKIWIVDYNDKIVAHNAIIPVVIKIGAEVVTGFQAADAMTHPDYRRQGIFRALDEETWRRVERGGMYIGYAFPGEFSYRATIKSPKWFAAATRRMMFKPLNWENTLRFKISNRFLVRSLAIGGNLMSRLLYRARKGTVVEGLKLTQVSRFDERINEFWAQVSSRYQLMVVRDKDYLNWRYVVPDTNYSIHIAEKEGKIHGYSVLSLMPREQAKTGVILDILSQSDEIAHCLTENIIEHCKREKVDLIYCQIISDRELLKALKGCGFMPMPFMRLLPFCVYSNAPNISQEFLQEPQNWLIQMGDSDMI
jgi:GNAT superfamily N-acetyltransferase